MYKLYFFVYNTFHRGDKLKKLFYYSFGFLAGVINGLLGAGGGMLTVTILKKLGLSQKKAHATSVCVILPICIFSSFISLFKGLVSLNQTIPYIPFSILGAIVGALILSKIRQKLLGKIFGIFVIWAASQLLFK